MDLYLNTDGILKAGNRYLPKGKFHLHKLNDDKITLVDIKELSIVFGPFYITELQKEDTSVYSGLSELLSALAPFLI